MIKKRNFLLLVWGALVLAGCAHMQTTPMQDEEQGIANDPADSTPAEVKPPIVNYRHVSLTDLNMNSQGNRITIKPGNVVQATLNYAYHCSNCRQDSNNQIIIGLANRSAQTCIYNGGPQGQGAANFELRVPAKPGRYDVRFRGLQAQDCAAALKAGWGADDTPPQETTIGKIIVSRKTDSLEQVGT